MKKKNKLILNWILVILLGIGILSNIYFVSIKGWIPFVIGWVISAELMFILFNLNKPSTPLKFGETLGEKALCLFIVCIVSIVLFVIWDAISKINIKWSIVGIVISVIAIIMGYVLLNRELGNWLGRL